MQFFYLIDKFKSLGDFKESILYKLYIKSWDYELDRFFEYDFYTRDEDLIS